MTSRGDSTSTDTAEGIAEVSATAVGRFEARTTTPLDLQSRAGDAEMA